MEIAEFRLALDSWLDENESLLIDERSAAAVEAKIVTACVLIIGNEILSGRTQDANLAYIAKGLNDVGVRLREARVIPDVPETIINTVNEVRARHDYVFTTGGIGPTHDDITADAIRVIATIIRELVFISTTRDRLKI